MSSPPAGSGRPAVCVVKTFGVPIDTDPGRARHPARMAEDGWRRDERGAPAHDAYSQGRRSHLQLPASSRVSAPSIGRLRQLRPARISRATTQANTDGKAKSRRCDFYIETCGE